jgi:hypothetical protein
MSSALGACRRKSQRSATLPGTGSGFGVMRFGARTGASDSTHSSGGWGESPISALEKQVSQ